MKYLHFFILFALGVSACQPPQKKAIVSDAVNTPETITKPYVIMVSMDGFRYDYAEKYGAKNILNLANEGIKAEAMIPSFPSSTFPNHYSLVTGLYPAHHKLVSNTFFDKTRGQMYKISDREKVEDGSWYGGTPLWVLAAEQGMVAASYFWVGSEAEIKGKRPAYYYTYDSGRPNRERTDQVIDWLKLPEEQRPHFITLYFSDVDSKGHNSGPESDDTQNAVLTLDEEIGYLDRKVNELGLPVNIILVSDHGMLQVDTDHPVFPEDEVNLSDFTIAKGTTYWLLYSDDTTKTRETALALHEKEAGRYTTWLRADVPAHLHYNGSPLIGDIVLIATPPYILTSQNFSINPGHHGYDPTNTPEMGAIFYAKGPAFRKGLTIPPFENVNVYPLIAKILSLEITGPIDGNIAVLDSILAR